MSVQDSTSMSQAALDQYRLWVRKGISTGCMGSLSTVSTWVSELHRLPTTHAYFYGFASIAVAQAIVIGSHVFSGEKNRFAEYSRVH